MSRRFLIPMVVAAVLLASCGGSDETTTSSTAGEEATLGSQAADGSQSESQDTLASTESDEATDDSTTDDSTAAADDSTTDDSTADDSTADNDAASGAVGDGTPLSSIDWWGCWRAESALDGGGGTPSDGARVASVPNCATGSNSIGSLGDLSHPDSPPVFRSGGANGHPSIEFTHEGDTLLQTNGGGPWDGDAVLPAGAGVTLAWIGTVTDVNSHNVKYLVSGLNDASEYPMLLVEGEGPNRFAGYGGGNIEARSSDGIITDFDLQGVILYLAPDGSSSVMEVDGDDIQTGQDSALSSDVIGLTVGNIFSRNFSTTDHQFVFLGMHGGQLSDDQKAQFWDYVNSLQ